MYAFTMTRLPNEYQKAIDVNLGTIERNNH